MCERAEGKDFEQNNYVWGEAQSAQGNASRILILKEGLDVKHVDPFNASG